MKCPSCGKNEAISDRVYGVLPCDECRLRMANHPKFYSESEPESIKEQRKKYAKDMIQPWRGDEPSREFIDAYPSQAKKIFSESEMKKAKKVWN